MISDFATAVRDVPTRDRIGGPIAILVLSVFAAVGIDVVIHPRRYMHGYLGGEMLRELTEAEIQVAGVIFTAVVSWMLWEVSCSVWHGLFG